MLIKNRDFDFDDRNISKIHPTVLPAYSVGVGWSVVTSVRPLRQVVATKAGHCLRTNWQDFLDVPERHGYNKLARELGPAGLETDASKYSGTTLERDRNRSQLSTRHNDDDDVRVSHSYLNQQMDLYPGLLILLRTGEIATGTGPRPRPHITIISITRKIDYTHTSEGE